MHVGLTGVLRALQRECGERAALIVGNPAWVAACGPKYNQQVLSDARLFHNSRDIPQKVPEDSAPTRLNNGVHRRIRRLVMPRPSSRSQRGATRPPISGKRS